MKLNKSTVTVLTIAALLIVYLIKCNGTFLTIDEVAKRKTFTVEETNFRITIDGPAILHVRGKLDGKAAIFIPTGSKEDSRGLPVWGSVWLNGPNPGVLKLKPGEIDTLWHCRPGLVNLPLVYQPLSAKNGWLTIDVDY
jgi:hypothetical protein